MQTQVDRQPAGINPEGFDAVIADANRLNAESIAWCLKSYGGFRTVSPAISGTELLAALRAQRPALILMGEKVVVKCFREVFGELAVKLGEIRVAVFADDLSDRQLDLVVHNRVSGLLSRHETMRRLSEQLSQIAAGQTVLSDHLRDRIEHLGGGQFRCTSSAHLEKLTERQWEVLLRIARGGRVSEVAQALHISEKAVESHKYRIMRVVGAVDRLELCRWAIREGLIEA
jgi:DNA-binding NarL/FixJ family response regulator